MQVINIFLKYPGCVVRGCSCRMFQVLCSHSEQFLYNKLITRLQHIKSTTEHFFYFLQYKVQFLQRTVQFLQNKLKFDQVERFFNTQKIFLASRRRISRKKLVLFNIISHFSFDYLQYQYCVQIICISGSQVVVKPLVTISIHRWQCLYYLEWTHNTLSQYTLLVGSRMTIQFSHITCYIVIMGHVIHLFMHMHLNHLPNWIKVK